LKSLETVMLAAGWFRLSGMVRMPLPVGVAASAIRSGPGVLE